MVIQCVESKSKVKIAKPLKKTLTRRLTSFHEDIFHKTLHINDGNTF